MAATTTPTAITEIKIAPAAPAINVVELLADLRAQATRRRFKLADDAAFFAQQHASTDFGITVRQLIERAIVRRAVQDAIAAGYVVTVDYREGDYPVKRSANADEIMAAINACDEEYLHVLRKDEGSPTGHARMGSVFLVYGNDGWDVISDYSIRLEPILAGANTLADAISDAL